AALEKSLHIAPEHTLAARHLAMVELLDKKPTAALDAVERSTSGLSKDYCKAMALHDLGRTADAQRVLDEVISHYGHRGAYQIAEAYAWFGEPEKAFEWLDRAYAQRDGGLLGLKFDPMLRGLRGDPRYAALLAKMNLPPG